MSQRSYHVGLSRVKLFALERAFLVCGSHPVLSHRFVPGMSELSLLPHSDPEKRMTQAQWMETPGWSLADVQVCLDVV